MFAEWKQKSKLVIFEPRFRTFPPSFPIVQPEKSRTIVYRKAELENIRVICMIVYATDIQIFVTRANLCFPTTISPPRDENAWRMEKGSRI